uniref:Uncharacterized protein n=1 Tax=Ananas comosus var. bracteatus TaxID=296719 RepID=A0A6V7NIM2_ANACO|nr:unnamed protein product [Ananas comosus var. bracteatus]
MANGTRLRQQTTSYNQSFEEALQSARVVNQKLDVLVEALQKEEARRHEIMMQENARRHEQLLELIRSRFVHAREEEITVQVPKEEKELIPIPIPLEKKVSSLTNSVIYQPAAVKDAEQKHQMNLQIGASRKYEAKLRDGASKPEERLKLLAAQPPLLRPAYNALNAYTAPTEMGSTAEAAEDTAHNSKENIDHDLIEGAAASKRATMQGRCYGYGEEYIIGKQCKNSSLHVLQTQKKVEMGVESETAKEEERELQKVDEGNVYEAIGIKESDNQTQLILNDDRNLHSLIDFVIAKATQVESTTFATLRTIADCDHKMLNKSYYPQFAKNKREHRFLADSRKWGSKIQTQCLEFIG